MLRLTLSGPFSLTGPDGAELKVTSKKSMALLAYLAHSPGHRRSREEIMAMLWSTRAEAQGRASLRQVLAGLRREVGADLLIVDRDSVALNPVGVTLAPPNGKEFLAGFNLRDPAFEDWLRDERLRMEDVQPAAAPSPPSLGERQTIAVLPLANLSGDPDQSFFSDGITRDITTELSRFKELLVMSPLATFQYRDKPVPVQTIGDDLGAAYIVGGGIQKAGNRVRINVQLTDAQSAAQLWSTRYDRDLTDIFEIQEEVARQIAVAVTGTIELQRIDQVNRRSHAELTAYQLALRGEWQNWRAMGNPAALACFEQAIAVDPGYGRAHALVANWYAYHVYGPTVTIEEATAKVNSYGQRAIDLDPDDVVSLSYLAASHLFIGNHGRARTLIEKAIRTNPNHSQVILYAAMVLAWLGETEVSIEWLDRYRETSVLSFDAEAEVFFEVYFFAERFDDAIEAMALFPNVTPDIAAELAAAHAHAGRIEEAHALRRRFESEKPEGYSFEDHAASILRTCARERERALWREGYGLAGFPV